MKMTVKSEDSFIEVECDRYAFVRHSELAAVSFVSSEAACKAVIATLQAVKSRSTVGIENGGAGGLCPEGYRISRSKLPKYGAVHVTAVAKLPGIVFGDQDQALESYLLSPAISTPVLPEWVPYLVKKLIKLEWVKELNSVGIAAYWCTFESPQLDQLVSNGLKEGFLKIPRKEMRHAS